MDMTRLSNFHVPVLWLLLRGKCAHWSGFPASLVRLWSPHQELACCNLVLPLSLEVLLKWKASEVSFVPHKCDSVFLAYVLGVYLEYWHMERKKSKVVCWGMS